MKDKRKGFEKKEWWNICVVCICIGHCVCPHKGLRLCVIWEVDVNDNLLLAKEVCFAVFSNTSHIATNIWKHTTGLCRLLNRGFTVCIQPRRFFVCLWLFLQTQSITVRNCNTTANQYNVIIMKSYKYYLNYYCKSSQDNRACVVSLSVRHRSKKTHVYMRKSTFHEIKTSCS